VVAGGESEGAASALLGGRCYYSHAQEWRPHHCQQVSIITAIVNGVVAKAKYCR